MECKYCGSVNTIKKSMFRNFYGTRQRYLCKECGKRFMGLSSDGKKEVCYIWKQIINEQGRVWYPNEYKYIMRQFNDPYDPRALAIELSWSTGLRILDGARAELKWFDDEFMQMDMTQCKAHVEKKSGITRMTTYPKNCPLPKNLSFKLKNYVQYRLSLGRFLKGEGVGTKRLFPGLNPQQIRNFLSKLRLNHGNEQPWLRDVWFNLFAFDKDKNIIWKRTFFRIGTHACRANYVTIALQECETEKEAKFISGHKENKNWEAYLRFFKLNESKLRIANRINEQLSEQKTPILTGQKRLIEYA